MPLQVGLSSLKGALRGNVVGWSALVLFVGSFFLVGVIVRALSSLGDTIGLVVGGAAWLVGALVAIFAAVVATDEREQGRRERPSDLVLDAAGVRVEGGQAHGLGRVWKAINGCTVVRETEAKRVGLRQTLLAIATLGRWRKRPEVWNLMLATDAGDVVLARSDDPEEVASFRALASCVAALASEGAAPRVPPPPEAPTVLVCDECAAPLPPRDAASVSCGHCGRDTPVPDELRARLRAPDEIARGRSAERHVAKLLAQPGQGAATAVLKVARLVMTLAWPAALAAFVVLLVLQHRQPKPFYPAILVVEGWRAPYARDVLLGASFLGIVVGASWATASAALANRRALRMVSLGLAAVPPPHPGEPYACRSCAAPLPERPGRMVAACLHCGVENVLGIDLRLPADRARGQVRSVDEALRHRRFARARLAFVAVLAVGATALITRELAWATRLAPRAPRSYTGCVLCSAARIQNRDRRGRLVTVVDGARTRRRVVPGRSTVEVACESKCTVRVGGDERTLRRARNRLAIEDGRFVE